MANMVVRTNVFALNAHRNMKNVGLEQRRSSNRLSSGYRINSAADDAAGLAISETMRAQIRGLDQASRNAQDGQAMILTTEGGLEEIGNMLVRVRELLVQAANDTNTADQRVMIDQEINQLGREILSMQNRVEFNSNRVLAMGPSIDPLVITAVSDIEIASTNVATWASDLNTLRDSVLRLQDLLMEMDPSADIPTSGAVFDALVAAQDLPTFAIDGTLVNLTLTAPNAPTETLAGATVGEVLTQIGTLLGEINTTQEEISTEAAVIRTEARANYDLAREFATFDVTNRAENANTGNNIAFFQVGANSSQGVSFDFETVSRTVSAAGWVTRIVGAAMAAPGAGSGIGEGISISPMIGMIDSSIADVNSVRANLGAVQNRMEFTMRSLDISSENLQDSESRVRNADVAREMMRFTMTNVLQQAAVSMLSQANQLPNNLLQLLR
jgi:flagellin